MVEPAHAATDTEAWPALPTETDIYILPDGRVVIADLPVFHNNERGMFIKLQVPILF